MTPIGCARLIVRTTEPRGVWIGSIHSCGADRPVCPTFGRYVPIVTHRAVDALWQPILNECGPNAATTARGYVVNAQRQSRERCLARSATASDSRVDRAGSRWFCGSQKCGP